jgi:hypothetical protein
MKRYGRKQSQSRVKILISSRFLTGEIIQMQIFVVTGYIHQLIEKVLTMDLKT